MTTKTYEIKLYSIVSLVLLMSLNVQASLVQIKSWSDATVCRVIGENHASEATAEYQAEANRRGIYCLEKNILSKDEASMAGLIKNDIADEKISATAALSAGIPNASILEQPIDSTATFVVRSSEAAVYQAGIEVLKNQLESAIAGESINNEVTSTDGTLNSTTKMSAYGTDSEGLESQLERLIGKEVAEDSRTNISRIADLQISIQKRSEALYSGLVVMIILLVSSLYFVSHRAKIIKSRQCPNNEYDASDNIVHLNNIRDELLSTINKSTDAVGIVATLDKFRT